VVASSAKPSVHARLQNTTTDGFALGQKETKTERDSSKHFNKKRLNETKNTHPKSSMLLVLKTLSVGQIMSATIVASPLQTTVAQTTCIAVFAVADTAYTTVVTPSTTTTTTDVSFFFFCPPVLLLLVFVIVVMCDHSSNAPFMVYIISCLNRIEPV